MKKLFMALMAALVMVSCGGSKSSENKGGGTDNGANNGTETPSVNETALDYGDIIQMTADVTNKAASSLAEADCADDFIDVMETMHSDMQNLQNKYAGIIAGMDRIDEEELYEKYPAEVQAMDDAMRRYMTAAQEKMVLMQNLTPEQEERFNNIINAEL